MKKTVELVTWSLALERGKTENFHSVFSPVANEASNFINFHFENGLFRVEGRRAHKKPQN